MLILLFHQTFRVFGEAFDIINYYIGCFFVLYILIVIDIVNVERYKSTIFVKTFP